MKRTKKTTAEKVIADTLRRLTSGKKNYTLATLCNKCIQALEEAGLKPE
jgi:hypothetical protein